MKKRITVAFVLVGILAAFSFMFTSCDEPLIAPSDTWCKTTATVQGTDLDVYFLYTEEGSKYESYGDGPGLTVFVAQKGAEAGGYYVKKTFAVGSEVNTSTLKEEGVEDTTADKTFKMTATTWDAIYIFYYKSDFMKTHTTGVPAVIAKGNDVANFAQLVNDVTSKLSWKQIVLQLLTAWLS